MTFSRARIVPVLLLALAGTGVVLLQAPASSVVPTTNITSPLDGAHYTVTQQNGSVPDVTVTGTSNLTTGDFIDIRCYEVGSSWYQGGPSHVAVQADGTFSAQMSIGTPYGTCQLLAVPYGWPKGSGLSGYIGPRVTTEYRRDFKTTSGPNVGRTYDYSVAYQGAHALFDLSSATHGGYWESRLNYPEGSSSDYFWDTYGAALGAFADLPRSQIRVDGRNAFGPNSAHNLASNIPGNPSLTWTVWRDGSTGITRIKEHDPLVACPKGAPYPPVLATCPKMTGVGVDLDRTYVIVDGGRQVHVIDIWRSVDGKSHLISPYYMNQVHGFDYVANAETDVAVNRRWTFGGFTTYAGQAVYAGPTKLANSILVRDSDTASDPNSLLPRGALTFDFPGKVDRAGYNNLVLQANSFGVSADGSRTTRQSFVIANNEADMVSKAAAQRVRINPYRADAQIEKLGSGSLKGNNVYNTTAAGQSVTLGVHRSSTATFLVAIQNDGTQPDTFVIKGGSAPAGFTVNYLLGRGGRTSITTAVVHGKQELSISPGVRKYLRIEVSVKAGTSLGKVASWLVTATSLSDATRKDAVKAVVEVR
ncbi:hypothetical protein [Nocardioides marmorisolisilvae]|uniref:Uncharacterized protein n=1 Tax=Nocardioides marmorisolisilvae TaxID=1542737 RepID=A0A3N0DPU6_9ACTN|nr:hypothetical protein [Nocardioides marmorisolisilvae]RNL77679.1 hypothetical protein EFL95_16875 [Nocardioides marmorisolisilvae]